MKKITSPVKAIRKHCLDCVGNSPEEVRTCTAGSTCFLHPFRFGRNPHSKMRPPELTEEQKAVRDAKMREVGKRNRREISPE